ncbi:hypothetical protein CDG76_19205 [Nostoc sp. 'Peltigera membranacea cyanobiont' 210A]|uniref:hypothetical protein n=1 Tax=Nostoc sp. 'Peltigera membranacea cyanobiont' 210A TaxID=2014529 RepID=UPI000B955B2C|nr:hypothetical protein [Nostoc sp. 'Peltigera membranacea cyanobiont' 210A]OYD92852.1 hypothetical protein CDG76_19205 [Nostoc sp. 'Peltigera membranacea cyanobiont' 210A]
MLKIRDLDCQHSYLESLNDEKVENLVRGGGTTILLLTSGTVGVYDDTGAKIDASTISSASIFADAAGNKIVTGGTLIKATVTPVKRR